MALRPEEERRPASPREITLPEGFIVLSYLGANEGGRIGRLVEIAARLEACAPMTFRKLLRLHDHKGCLEAHWSDVYSEADCVLIEFLWADQAEQQVSHFDLTSGGRCFRLIDGSGPPPTGAAVHCQTTSHWRDVYQTLWSRYDRRADC